MTEIEKAYSPEAVERKWLQAWRRDGVSRAEARDDGRKSFTVVIPPPNVTGALHIGHALNNTLQDVLIRWHRLSGEEACWVPGTDHGGIATQNVMEKQLKAEGKSRRDLGRAAFLARMQEWTRQCQGTILGQLDRLGCSLDWERTAFTMDSPRAGAVLDAFSRLWEEGHLYRGKRMINWCVRCGTALSDIEVEHEDRKGKLWRIRYPLEDGGEGLTVATTRPETLLGDTAVVVNPADERYRALVGRKLRLPLEGRLIPVVADEHVDPKFGTGAVKVTPNHDPNDFDIWNRHKGKPDAFERPAEPTIGYDGKITRAHGAYAGLSREKAREKVLADLEAQGLLGDTEEHAHSVGTCYRCQQVVEPMVSEQWFMRMQPLAAKALGALERDEFRLWPDSWEGPYRDWLENIRDWCLSRQIWWGHRIPSWYCAACAGDKIQVLWPEASGVSEQYSLRALLERGIPLADVEKMATAILVGVAGSGDITQAAAPPWLKCGAERPGPCAFCGGDAWLQDPDVLDTWFSSALWPLSVFGWPEETRDLKFFYPTAVLATGYEILYLWVARMQMMGLHFLGKAPFRDAVIHGIVRDKSGKKMSKSLGNVVDPLLMMDAHGTDAFRFSLIRQAYPGKDIPYGEDSIKGPRNFANKIWNSTRFVLMNMPQSPGAVGAGQRVLLKGRVKEPGWELADYWIVSEFNRLRDRVAGHLERYEVAAAADDVYGFLWDKFCDWYIELAKIRLQGADSPGKDAVREVLIGVLTGTLKLLHPFMPYLTEELYQALKPYNGEAARFILESSLPAAEGGGGYAVDPEPMAAVMEAVSSIRALRSQLEIPPGRRIAALYSGKGSRKGDEIASQRDYVAHLAQLERLEPTTNGRPPQSGAAVAGDVTFYVPLAGLVETEKVRAALAKKVAGIDAELGRLDGQLANEGFLSRAPREEVARLRGRQGELRGQKDSLQDTLRALGGV